jgi:magnesium transporter
VLRLTDHLKQDVRDARGARVGRLRDIVVRLGEEYPRVTRLVVGGRDGLRFVPWERVSSFERAQVTLSLPERELDAGEEEPSDLLLGRDVLDCQIVDVEGKRIARVGDVELVREGDELRCVAVETGLGPIARRFGLDWLAERLSPGTVAWASMHLTADPGHQLQLESPASSVHRLTPEELMHLVGRLSVEHGAEVLEVVPARVAAGALSAGRPELGARLLQELEIEKAAELLAHMPVDDAATALRALEHPDRSELLGALDPQRAGRIARLLEHAEGTAGSLMTPDAQTANVGESIASIRDRLAARPPRLDGLLTVVLIDEQRRPQGVLPASVVLAGRGAPVAVPPVRTDSPLDEVMELFAAYDVLAVPVVDSAGALAGVVAVDDILDTLLAEHRPGETRYPVMSARRRAPA